MNAPIGICDAVNVPRTMYVRATNLFQEGSFLASWAVFCIWFVVVYRVGRLFAIIFNYFFCKKKKNNSTWPSTLNAKWTKLSMQFTLYLLFKSFQLFFKVWMILRSRQTFFPEFRLLCWPNETTKQFKRKENGWNRVFLQSYWAAVILRDHFWFCNHSVIGFLHQTAEQTRLYTSGHATLHQN